MDLLPGFILSKMIFLGIESTVLRRDWCFGLGPDALSHTFQEAHSRRGSHCPSVLCLADPSWNGSPVYGVGRCFGSVAAQDVAVSSEEALKQPDTEAALGISGQSTALLRFGIPKQIPISLVTQSFSIFPPIFPSPESLPRKHEEARSDFAT